MGKALRKQIALLMLSIVMLFSFAATSFAAYESEPNNTLATADVYDYGESAAGMVNDSDLVDYWKINNVPTGLRYLNGYSEIAMAVLDSWGYVIATKPVGVYSISFTHYYSGPIYVAAYYTPGSGIYYYGYTVN